jgi:NAD(P)-dependent dehydrogenase (short-subunit alcohol dehydrogenase family)
MLEGTVTVVTGASRGIGREIALTQAAAGAKVGLLARDGDALAALADEIRAKGGAAHAVAADLRDRPAVDDALSAVATTLGPIDTLISNAGAFAAIGPIWEVDPDAWWSDVEINLKSTFCCARAVLPAMIARRSGRIINLIGGGTSTPLPFGSAYSISKTGILRFTECLAATLADTGVVCLALDPGLVQTDLTRYQMETEAGARYLPGVTARLSSGRHVPPSYAARLTLDIARGRFDRLTGRAIGATEDRDAVEASIDAILADEKRVLRVAGFAPPQLPADAAGMPGTKPEAL